jgi:hypothetical protein
MDVVLWLVLLTPYALGLMALAINAWRLYVIYRDSPIRRATDVSGEHRPMPPKLMAWANELKQLGFVRLGELEAVLPAIGLLRSLTRRTERHTAWIWVDPERVTEAAVVPGLVEFSSRYADGSYVETMYPIGEQIDDRDLIIRRVKSSVSDAYARHREILDARMAEHGPLRPISTMADQAVHDRVYRVRHARRQLRTPLIVRGLLPLAATALFIAALAWMSFPAIDTIARVLSR